jgi:hypothetical protein
MVLHGNKVTINEDDFPVKITPLSFDDFEKGNKRNPD